MWLVLVPLKAAGITLVAAMASAIIRQFQKAVSSVLAATLTGVGAIISGVEI